MRWLNCLSATTDLASLDNLCASFNRTLKVAAKHASLKIDFTPPTAFASLSLPTPLPFGTPCLAPPPAFAPPLSFYGEMNSC